MLEQNTKIDEKSAEHHEGSRRERRRNKQGSGRVLSWPTRIIGSIVLIFISWVVGLAIGYSGMGHGPIGDVFHIQTYKHMYDLVFK
ncbi:MAG TPA: DNA-directed RNA polymerase subunit beta [Bacillota bacterium]|nr:DNA-directed RNA polymerase subunit beta [Bacillota bacterium]